MISIVIPCFNEELIIEDFVKELQLELLKINETFEIIFVDNKSKDKTINKLKDNLKIFDNAKILCLTNYFGKESAILSGIDHSKGQSCIIMDPDLEDPPSLINEMISEWKKGFNVVYAVRKTIKTTFFKKIMRSVFYFLYQTLVDKNFIIPENTGDFRLIDKKIIEQLKSMRERTRFLRGLVSFIGAKQKSINFDRPFRKKGKSKSSIFFLIKYGFDALLSSTAGPASLITKFGIFSLSIIFIFLVFILVNKFFFNPYEGFSFTVILILFLFSLNTIMIGIIGEYVTRIYNEVKQRPNYIIEEIIDQ
jgi:polyisoprenyl-phosphate glycosyltransferase